MTDLGQRARHSAVIDNPAGYSSYGSSPTGWVAWVIFAGIMMALDGTFMITQGLVALFNPSYYLVHTAALPVSIDWTAWGWVHLTIGVLLVAAGICAVLGQFWARAVGVLLAVISAVVSLLFIAAYPVWSMLIITLDVVVIYALIVHGGELKDV